MASMFNTSEHVKLAGFILLCLLVIVTFTFISPISATSKSIRVEIKSTGVVHVRIIGEIREGLNEILLPIRPIPISLEVYVNNTLVPSILVNNSVYIPSSGKGFLTIDYIANTTTVNGKSVLEVASTQELALVIEPGIILLSLPTNIVKTYYENNNLVIMFYGPTILEYTIATTPTSPMVIPKKEAETPFLGLLEYVAIVGVLLIITLVIIAVKKFRKHKIEEEITIIELDETDRKILKGLKDSGGTIIQSELRKKLGIPKATFWRHVKRLEKLGYIEVRRKGRTSELILKKKEW